MGLASPDLESFLSLVCGLRAVSGVSKKGHEHMRNLMFKRRHSVQHAICGLSLSLQENWNQKKGARGVLWWATSAIPRSYCRHFANNKLYALVRITSINLRWSFFFGPWRGRERMETIRSCISKEFQCHAIIESTSGSMHTTEVSQGLELENSLH